MSTPPVWSRSLAPFVLLSGILLVLFGGDHSVRGLATPERVDGSFQADTLEQVRFQEATDLEVDPRGRLYVADAGRDAIVILSSQGRKLAELGGSGTRAGQFLDPADVDPTNGQSVFVADAGNGRLQRFSEEQQYLESLPVGRNSGAEWTQRALDDGRDGSDVRGDGRPIAVESSPEDHTFAIDERTGTVVKWDEQRRPDRTIGGDGQRRGRLERPVALALESSRQLYVADRERGGVFVYDRFGTFERRLPTPPLPEVRALTFRRGRLWIVCPNRVLVWHASDRRLDEHPVDLPGPLVDVAPGADGLYLLTRTRLWLRDVSRP